MSAIDQLVEVPVTDYQWNEFLRCFVPVTDTKRGKAIADRKRSELDAMWNSDERVTPWRHTGFGVLQAVNTWTQHQADIRGDESREEKQMLNTINGKFAANDDKALVTMQSVGILQAA